MYKKRILRQRLLWPYLLITLSLTLLSTALVGCSSTPDNSANNTSPAGTSQSSNPGPTLKADSTQNDVPQSRVELMIGGALSGTLLITGTAHTLPPLEQNGNPYQLHFYLKNAQGQTILIDVENFVGPRHYPLHGNMTEPKDALILWTSSDQQKYWYMKNTTYDTTCDMYVDSDTVSPYQGLHEVKGSFSCSELLYTEDFSTIACSATFDVFVKVLD